MSNELMISYIYRAIGLLEGVKTMRGAINCESNVFNVLGECMDLLDTVGAELITKDVRNDEKTEGCVGFFFTPRHEKPDQ